MPSQSKDCVFSTTFLLHLTLSKSFIIHFCWSKVQYTGLLGRWDKELVDQAYDVPSINFFHKILQNYLQKSFECPKFMRNYSKKNTWNVRHFIDESFVPSAQRTKVLYCRLTDFKLLTRVSIFIKSYYNMCCKTLKK